MTSKEPSRIAWLRQLKSTEAADRSRAEIAVRRLYTAAGFPEPRHVFWFASPCAASWPVAAVVADGNPVWKPLLSSRDDQSRLEQARADLVQRVGASSWKEACGAIGRPRVGTLMTMPDPSLLFTTALFEARFTTVEDVSVLFAVPGDEDDLERAESHFRGGTRGVLTSALHCPSTSSIIGNSFFSEYSFSSMATDEERVGDRQPPAILDAAWEVARSAGMIWPFEHAAFLCDRPAELYVNERHLLHREDGPAAVYRDGWRVFAWNGTAVPERWITDPASVPTREYKGFDPTYAAFAAPKGKPHKAPAGRTGPDAIAKVVLPADPAARLTRLQQHAGGSLSRFDRYQRGEHREVWKELVSLGDAVREAPHAADALAVAYQTMGRVERNVRTLVKRLGDMGYVFSPDGRRSTGLLGAVFGAFSKAGSRKSQGHVPPSADIGARVATFEKEYGALPLSLRAFYEVVGEVNFIGSHPTLDPKGNSIAPDPLLVYGLDDGIVQFDDDEEEPSAVVIAPDDLHKADTSGGDPYEMMIPDLRADGELLNERHNLFFVDYLRLVFEYGGFPGYEGHAKPPAELETLKAGLLEF